MDTIDQWLDIVGRGRANIAPEQIPWEAIGTLLSQAIYGGKMDNPFDQRLLDTFLAKVRFIVLNLFFSAFEAV